MPAPVRHVLFPGRHHLVTRFQTAHLHRLLAGQVADADGVPVECAPDADVVWAVTSATHSGTRRNPVPYHRREAAIERAHHTPEVLELWKRVDACCDYVRLDTLAEARQDFATFEAVQLS